LLLWTSGPVLALEALPALVPDGEVFRDLEEIVSNIPDHPSVVWMA
jgi:hypothetical protein